MHTPPQLRFVSVAHPSRAYSRSRHPLLSMFLVSCAAYLPAAEWVSSLIHDAAPTQEKYRGLALNATRTLRSPSCVDVPSHETVQSGVRDSRRSRYENLLCFSGES